MYVLARVECARHNIEYLIARLQPIIWCSYIEVGIVKKMCHSFPTLTREAKFYSKFYVVANFIFCWYI